MRNAGLHTDKMFIVVVYDIKDDRLRSRVCNTLKNYGSRIQMSVFECNLSRRQYEKMKGEVSRLIDEERDLVRFYLLCRDCVSRCELLGEGKITEDVDMYLA